MCLDERVLSGKQQLSKRWLRRLRKQGIGNVRPTAGTMRNAQHRVFVYGWLGSFRSACRWVAETGVRRTVEFRRQWYGQRRGNAFTTSGGAPLVVA
ncbi:hypothetical protein VTN02DRAFT_4467 [Thermoascus thermophilus]